MNLNEELWKDITTHKGQYQISNLGRIKRLQTTVTMSNQFSSWNKILPEKVLKPSLDSKGYEHIILKFPKRTARIHRLVAESFLKEPSETLVKECLKSGSDVVLINHKDGNKLNNRYDNLEWCDQVHNMKEASRMGLLKIKRGAESNLYSGKLNIDISNMIRSIRSNEKLSYDKIAKMFDVSKATIINICKNRIYT